MTKRKFITIINLYTNNKASKYMKQNLADLNGEMDNFQFRIGYFNASLSTTNRTRQNVSKIQVI